MCWEANKLQHSVSLTPSISRLWISIALLKKSVGKNDRQIKFELFITVKNKMIRH